ncbi:hypothetical protein M2447_002760, partial [Ereboglobus sp. PH5-10]|nr:hypothetical protein [Ereboglobus sp. PH5-10]
MGIKFMTVRDSGVSALFLTTRKTHRHVDPGQRSGSKAKVNTMKLQSLRVLG